MYIDKLKKELEQKQSYLEELEELEIPSTQHLHNWLYSLRSNNHGSCTVVNELQHTETNKKLYRQKLDSSGMSWCVTASVYRGKYTTTVIATFNQLN